MDAQWMLKGCSMDAERFLHPLSPLSNASILTGKIAIRSSLSNFLQRYNKYLEYASFLLRKMKFIYFCEQNTCYSHNCAAVFSGELAQPRRRPKIQQIFHISKFLTSKNATFLKNRTRACICQKKCVPLQPQR